MKLKTYELHLYTIEWVKCIHLNECGKDRPSMMKVVDAFPSRSEVEFTKWMTSLNTRPYQAIIIHQVKRLPTISHSMLLNNALHIGCAMLAVFGLVGLVIWIFGHQTKEFSLFYVHNKSVAKPRAPISYIIELIQ